MASGTLTIKTRYRAGFGLSRASAREFRRWPVFVEQRSSNFANRAADFSRGGSINLPGGAVPRDRLRPLAACRNGWWVVAVLGAEGLGAGLAWAGFRLSQALGASGWSASRRRWTRPSGWRKLCVSQDQRVVLTGAAGRIGRAIAPRLAPRWDLHCTDLQPDVDTAALDVTDLEACRSAFTEASAVVHLAAVPDPEATWEQLLPANVIGVYNVARAAADVGVRRLVLASSLHAVGAVPEDTERRADDPARPANLYGASKAWAEAIGSWIAAEAPISVVALRIGWFFEQRPTLDDASHLALSAWLSTRDAAELVRAAVECDGIDFVVAHGISANRYRLAELERTMDRIGYQPVDDAFRDD